MQTHRLDPSQTPMSAAVQWLLDRVEGGSLDLSDTLVVTPGSRAGRVLVTLLARACQERGVLLLPPQTVTAGGLAEALAPAERPAGDVHRTLAWRQVLSEAPPELLRQVLPESEDPAQWADEVASAADELARGGFRCGEVAEAGLPPLEPPERWRALGELQQRYEELLSGAGLIDPTMHAIDSADVGAALHAIVLIACTDLSNIARRLLSHARCDVHVLTALDAGLEADGVVDVAYWDSADIDVDPQRVFVTGGPAEQGALAVRAAVDLGTSAIGTADESIAGALRRAAHEHGVDVHIAWGTPVLASGPARLLGDIALLLREQSFSSMARVLRSPAVIAGLSSLHAEFAKLPRALDDYLSHAIPTRAFAPLPRGSDRATLPRRLVARSRRHVKRALEPLNVGAMPLREWAPRIEHALIALLEPAQDSLGGASLSALEAIGQQLRTLASLLASLDARPVPAHEAISLVLAQLARASATPEPAAEELDLLGWLELPLDPSPKLVVMGVHDSTLPAARPPGPLLTEGLRRALGLPGEGRALARDAASLTTLLASNREVRFVLGMSSAAGDPLLPSTLLLRGSGDGPARVLARVREAFETLPASDVPPRCSFRVGVMTPAPPLERMAVTSFKTYLESPYLFFLKHALKLREIEPRGIVPRLEANTFGTLLHEALRTFSADEAARDVTNEDTIRQLMHAALWDATERCAGKTQSAIMLAQIDAAERRLSSLAALEAQRRSEGWRTIAVEWKPDEPAALLDTGVGLTGSIDRIDWHEEDRTLALLDYKTSEDGRKPNSTHRRRDGSWTDLQLPLYELLAMPIASAQALERPPTLGYIALTRTNARLLDADWDEATRQGAVDCAVDVAHAVRRGIDAMRELGTPAYESALTRLAGVGLLLDSEHDMLRQGVAQ